MVTATDELRRLLDERGVEHYDGTERTLWGYEQTGEDTGIYRFAASEISGGFLQFDMFRITPAQAIAATLGADPRERGLIPHFWTGDWTLHIEAARLPERIDVTLPDERGREVHSARVHRFVPEYAMPSVPMDELRDFFYRCVPADIERWRDEDFQRVAHFFGAKVVDLREKS